MYNELLQPSNKFFQDQKPHLFSDGLKNMHRYFRKEDMHMAKKAYQESSIFLAVTETDIKTMLRYHYS